MWCALLLSAFADDYDAQKAAALAERDALAEELALGADDVWLQAHEALAHAVMDLLPTWEGPPWAMNGTTEVPGEGRVACGYLVSTVLRDVGLPVERVRLAQQGAEDIIRTLSDERVVRRYRGVAVSEVLQEHEADGVYVVGLDWHVGLLVVADGEQTFCHASRSAARQVVCERAAEARSLRSRYTVVGALSRRALESWLTGEPLPTVSD